MKAIPYSWHSKEQLQQLEVSVKLELHAIIKSHGSDSDEFWAKHDELVAVQEVLYPNGTNQTARA